MRSAIDKYIYQNPEIAKIVRGLPNPGVRPDGKPFSEGLLRIHKAYIDGNKVFGGNYQAPDSLKYYNSGNGSPLCAKPFEYAVKFAEKVLESSEISQYAFASGDLSCRRIVARYLLEEGFYPETGDQQLSEKNIIFYNSTTEAFSMVMQAICRPGDVILFTGPTYGLLAYAPERVGGISMFLPLKEEDNWLVNPVALAAEIRKINMDLATISSGDNAPCVKAFVNLNPNNPTGRVMGKGEATRLKGIYEACAENGVFVIDDIIYRDLCYDMDEKALPIACLPGTFHNTITLFGVSKCFGLAGARAGGVLADEAIIRGLRNGIFQLMDSTSLVVSYLMAGAFNSDDARMVCYNEYFPSLIQQYISNWKIVKATILGVKRAKISDTNILCFIRKGFGCLADEVITHGIPEIKIANDIEPESGFFCLLDLSALVGKKNYINDRIIRSEIDVLNFLFQAANVKVLTGESFAWPIKDQVVIRFSFAYRSEELIQMLYQIYLAIMELRS